MAFGFVQPSNVVLMRSQQAEGRRPFVAPGIAVGEVLLEQVAAGRLLASVAAAKQGDGLDPAVLDAVVAFRPSQPGLEVGAGSIVPVG